MPTVLFSILLIFVISVFFALFEYIKECPTLRKKKYFANVFNEVKIYSIDEKTTAKVLPQYLSEKELSDYLKEYTFATVTPLDIWNKKRDALQMQTNLKIIDITQDQNNMRHVNLIVQIRQLPEKIVWDDKYIYENANLLTIGMGTYGVVAMNLESYPHALIGGETGSGKSNLLKCMIHQSITKGYKTILIDFKRGVSFNQFSEHINVYYEYDTIMEILKSMVEETKTRLDLFRENHVENLNEYNAISKSKLERIIIFIDELAELLKTRDREIANNLTDSLETLLRLSRSAGISVVMGAQRPDSTIISGQIKNNANYRVCGRFVDPEPSRIMLNSGIAAALDNVKGRFIVKGDTLEEVQCFYFPNNVISYNSPVKQTEELNKENTDQSEKKKIDFDFSDINSK